MVGAGIAAFIVGAISGLEVTLRAFVWTFVGQAAGSFAVLTYLSSNRGTGNLTRDFGLEVRLEHWWGVPAGAVLQFAALLITLPLLQLLFPEGAPEQEVAAIARTSKTAIDAVLILVTVGILAPVVEEIVFRGMLLSRLLRSISTWWAIVAQAGLFAVIHVLFDVGAVAALPGLFLIGVVLGYAAIRSGSLSLPITLHAGVNLIAAVALIAGAA